MKAEILLAAARVVIEKKNPYFISLIHGLIPFETEEVETAGVTPGMVFYYNPRYIEGLLQEAGGDEVKAVDKAAFVVLHEGGHPLRNHHERRAGRDPDLWNRAGDIIINSDLRAMGWEPVQIALLPETYGLPDGLSTDEVYERLLQQQAAAAAAPMSQGQVCAGSCGSGAGSPDNGAVENRIDADLGRSSADCGRIQQQTAAAVEQHIQQHGRGSIPGSLLEWAKALKEPPTVSWRRVLSHEMFSACGRIESGGYDYSFSRISKRSFVRKLIRPGLVSYSPEGCLVIDTSGSMDKHHFELFLREASGVFRAVGLDSLWLLHADTRVAHVMRVRPKDLPSMEFHGRGGTDFRPAIEAASKLRPRPQFLIYTTDGDGDFPASPPRGMHVIWAIVPGLYSRRSPMPWGKTVFIKE